MDSLSALRECHRSLRWFLYFHIKTAKALVEIVKKPRSIEVLGYFLTNLIMIMGHIEKLNLLSKSKRCHLNDGKSYVKYLEISSSGLFSV